MNRNKHKKQEMCFKEDLTFNSHLPNCYNPNISVPFEGHACCAITGVISVYFFARKVWQFCQNPQDPNLLQFSKTYCTVLPDREIRLLQAIPGKEPVLQLRFYTKCELSPQF